MSAIRHQKGITLVFMDFLHASDRLIVLLSQGWLFVRFWLQMWPFSLLCQPALCLQTDSLEAVEEQLTEIGCPYRKALVRESGIMVTQIFFVSASIVPFHGGGF